MTPEQEARGAEMFASGASERQVAAELGVGAASAHRLRERLAAQAEPSAALNAEPTDAELATVRDEIAAALEAQQARAQASTQAVQDLERQQTDRLAAGLDAADLRPRLRDARDDLADWARSIALLRERLAEVDRRAGAIRMRQDLASLRAELDAAIAERAGVCARSGERQRAALAAVKAAAEEFCAVSADEVTAQERVTRLAARVTELAMQAGEPGADVPSAASTALGVSGHMSGPGLALSLVLNYARNGDVVAVAEQLGAASMWTPPAPPSAEEAERWQRMTEGRQAELERLRAAGKRGPVDDGDGRHVPVGLDHYGRPVDKFGNVLVPAGTLPHPMDVYQLNFAASRGSGAYGGGYRQHG
jgi:chromosome segregation ATPase